MLRILALGCWYSCIIIKLQKLTACSSEFEQSIPFSLRCRAALLATPSRYAKLEAAIEASPEASRLALTISFQVNTLLLQDILKANVV